jgi:hypothetical protein
VDEVARTIAGLEEHQRRRHAGPMGILGNALVTPALQGNQQLAQALMTQPPAQEPPPAAIGPLLDEFVGDSQGKPDNIFDENVQRITERYGALRPYDFRAVDSRGKESKHGGGLEFYHPDEPTNPVPGKPTVEVFDKDLQGEDLERAIFGDMLHYLPDSDPKFAQMREEFRETITPEQTRTDLMAYDRSRVQRGERREFAKWFDRTRLDAYIRGYLAPDKNDEWRRSGTYTPEQAQLLGRMNQYLETGGDPDSLPHQDDG